MPSSTDHDTELVARVLEMLDHKDVTEGLDWVGQEASFEGPLSSKVREAVAQARERGGLVLHRLQTRDLCERSVQALARIADLGVGGWVTLEDLVGVIDDEFCYETILKHADDDDAFSLDRTIVNTKNQHAWARANSHIVDFRCSLPPFAGSLFLALKGSGAAPKQIQEALAKVADALKSSAVAPVISQSGGGKHKAAETRLRTEVWLIAVKAWFYEDARKAILTDVSQDERRAHLLRVSRNPELRRRFIGRLARISLGLTGDGDVANLYSNDFSNDKLRDEFKKRFTGVQLPRHSHQATGDDESE